MRGALSKESAVEGASWCDERAVTVGHPSRTAVPDADTISMPPLEPDWMLS